MEYGELDRLYDDTFSHFFNKFGKVMDAEIFLEFLAEDSNFSPEKEFLRDRFGSLSGKDREKLHKVVVDKTDGMGEPPKEEEEEPAVEEQQDLFEMAEEIKLPEEEEVVEEEVVEEELEEDE